MRLITCLFLFSIFTSTAYSQLSCNSWLKVTTKPDAVSIGDLDVTGNKLTVEAMFSRTTPYTPSNDYRYAGDIVSKHMDPSDCNYLLRPRHAEITTTNGFFATPAVCDLELNKTYHVAMVYDGSTLKFYRNGFLMSQVPASGNLITNNYITKIGDVAGPWTPPPTNFTGYINEVRIWNVARTQVELKAGMNVTLSNPASQSGLMAYYTFSSLINKQGNNLWNGKLVGSAAINETNPSCNFVADSCEIVVPPQTNSCIKVLQANYGGTGEDVAYDVVDAGNGQFYMVGNTNSFGAGGTDILVVKMDGSKNIIWSNTYGVSGNETIRKASPSPDGGLLITGQTNSFANNAGDILCMKIKPDGSMQWVRTFGVGSANGDLGSDIIQTSDGGYAVSGILDVAGFVADGLVIKLDVNANQVWAKRFKTDIGEDGSSIVESGNKLIATFDIERQVGLDYAMAISELQTSNGQVLATKRILSTSKGIFRPIIYKDFGTGYWISGHLISESNYGQMEQVILHLNASYNITKTYKLVKSPLTNGFYTGFAPLKSGGFITCASEPLNEGAKGHIYKIAADGKVLFAKQISTAGKSGLNALTISGGKIITVGSEDHAGNADFYLADFDSTGKNDDLCNIDTSIVSVQDHPFTVSNFNWTTVENQAFSNTVQNLAFSPQTLISNALCTKDTCVVPVVVPDFTIPDTVCVNTPVTITNKTVGATTHYWSFCVADINAPPAAENLGNIDGTLSLPVFMDYAFDKGNYYGFVTNYYPGGLTRLDFGNSLLNTPTAISLGDLNGILSPGTGTEGIQVVFNEGKWYAIIVGDYSEAGGDAKVVRVEFGANLSNPSPIATDWGNVGNLAYPHDLHMFKEGNVWYGLTANAENNTLTRFNFTSSFDNAPTAINLGNLGNLAYPTGIYAINDNGFWRIFVVNGGNNTRSSGTFSLTRLDFGSSLLNTPTAFNLGNPGNVLKHPRDITIMKSCGQIVGFAVNGHFNFNEVIKLDFNNDLSTTPTAISLGNEGGIDFPHSISKLFRVNNDLYAFVTNVVNNSITRLHFAGCTDASLPNSILKDPPPISYSTAGVYSINLTIDDGLPTQGSVCKQVVVMPKPTLDFSYQQDICTPLQISFFGSDSTGKISWDFGDGSVQSNQLNPIHLFAKAGTFKVKFSMDGFCEATIEKSITVNIAFGDIIKNKDTIICEYGSVQLRADSAAEYCWTPSTYLSNPAIANPISKPLKDITYSLVSKTLGTNLVVNGSFEAGNSNFTSDYQYNSSGFDPAVYFVGSNLKAWHPAAPDCHDHTSGNGRMMLVNGAEVAGVKVWTQTINVVPGTNYEFSCWLQHVTSINPAKLQFSINGKPLGDIFNANSVSCVWDKFFVNWNSGNSTNAEISIINMNTEFSGNDFALDDIFFAPIVFKKDSVTIIIQKPSIIAESDTSVCVGSPVQLFAKGGNSYKWSPSIGLSADNIPNPVATPLVTTKYIVIGTTAAGCFGKDSVNIDVLTNVTNNYDFSYSQQICNPLQVQFYKNGVAKLRWDFGDGVQAFQSVDPTHLYQNFGTFNVKLIIPQEACQAKDTISKLINLQLLKANIIQTSDTAICSNGQVQLRADSAAEYCWTPSTYLSNNAIASPVAKPTQDITYYLVSKTLGKDLVVNGNFNGGNTGFNSGYNYSVSNTTEGEYSVGSNPKTWNGGLDNCNDHTNGTGNMLLMNGSPESDIEVWSQTISVTPNTNFEFSTWIQALWSPNPAKLQFSINGVILGEPIAASLPTCSWTRFNTNWNSGNNTTALISIVNKNTEIQGNDFALDDISFAPYLFKRDSVKISIDKPLIKTSNDTSVCAGSPVSLKTTAGFTYSWSPAAGLNNNSIGNPVATIQHTTSYIVTATTDIGCTAKDTVVISILPQPNLKVSNDTTICGAGSVQLSASGAATYQWTPAAGLNNPAIANPLASPLITTNYKLKATGTNGCMATDSINVEVLPPLVINISNDTSVCGNSKVQLQASGATNYKWSPSLSLSGTSISNPVASPSVTTKYKVIASNGNCNTIDSVTISILPSPTVVLSNDTSICKEGQANLIVSGGVSYVWSPSTGLSDISSPNPTAMPTVSTKYKVTVKGANTCAASDSLVVSILPPPSVLLSNDTTICGVGSVPLLASGGVSYIWSPSLGLNNSFVANPVASPSLSTAYQVKVTAANTCTATGTILVKVLPALVTGISNDTTVCSKKTVKLQANGGVKYQWTPATGLSNPLIANPIASPSATTLYSVKITGADNCVATESVTVTMLSLPVISLPNDTAICQSGSIQLNVTGGSSYKWSPAATLSNPLVANPIATPSLPTTYSVLVTGANNCTVSDSIIINIRPAAQFGVVTNNLTGCENQPVQLEAYGGDKYSWSPTVGLSNPLIANPIARLHTSQTFTVVVSESICKEQQSFVIPVIIRPLPAVVVSKSNDITCNTPFTQLKTNITGSNYVWTPSAGLSNANMASPIASPGVTTAYMVTVLDTNGCISKGAVTVKVSNNNDFRLYQMPNAFTPDGNGNNDCFGVAKWGNARIIYFEIYNRWGQLVFVGNNSRQCWDGVFNGKAQPSGNFVYKIKAETMCGVVERKGSVMLIR